MQLFAASTTVVLGLLTNYSQGKPVVQTRQQPALGQIADAQNQWAADTSKVSQFLSSAPSLSGQDLATQAGAALSSELDEKTHKAVLDAQFVFVANPDPSVQQANNILVDQGTFQFVVDGLTNLANNGASMSQDEIQSTVASINLDRCNLVLPAIDTYFTASGALLQNGVTLDANRPNNCP